MFREIFWQLPKGFSLNIFVSARPILAIDIFICRSLSRHLETRGLSIIVVAGLAAIKVAHMNIISIVHLRTKAVSVCVHYTIKYETTNFLIN